MNITILKNALEKYLCAAENDDEKLLCAKALEELTCVMDRYENADCWDNDAVLLPADSWVDILDAMTYDLLGERLHMHGDDQTGFHIKKIRKHTVVQLRGEDL